MHPNLDSIFAVKAKGGTPSDRPMGYPLGTTRAAARARILKNRPSTSTLIFDTILVPTWLHFGAQNTPNPSRNQSQEASTKMIDFGIDLLGILAPF